MPGRGPVALRRAVGEDAAGCRALAQRAYAPYLARMPVRPAPMDADYAAAVRDHEVWVAEADDGTLLGYLVLVAEADALLLDNVAVEPQAQGRGVGRRLLEHAEGRARDLGLTRLRLYTNVVMTENQRLYTRLGYVETGRDHSGRWRRVHFAKELTTQ